MIKQYSNTLLTGLSTDTKPIIDIIEGCVFVETDTHKFYDYIYYNSLYVWAERLEVSFEDTILKNQTINYYVSTIGSFEGVGTVGDPFDTINTALLKIKWNVLIDTVININLTSGSFSFDGDTSEYLATLKLYGDSKLTFIGNTTTLGTSTLSTNTKSSITYVNVPTNTTPQTTIIKSNDNTLDIQYLPIGNVVSNTVNVPAIRNSNMVYYTNFLQLDTTITNSENKTLYVQVGHCEPTASVEFTKIKFSDSENTSLHGDDSLIFNGCIIDATLSTNKDVLFTSSGNCIINGLGVFVNGTTVEGFDICDSKISALVIKNTNTLKSTKPGIKLCGNVSLNGLYVENFTYGIRYSDCDIDQINYSWIGVNKITTCFNTLAGDGFSHRIPINSGLDLISDITYLFEWGSDSGMHMSKLYMNNETILTDYYANGSVSKRFMDFERSVSISISVDGAYESQRFKYTIPANMTIPMNVGDQRLNKTCFISFDIIRGTKVSIGDCKLSVMDGDIFFDYNFTGIHPEEIGVNASAALTGDIIQLILYIDDSSVNSIEIEADIKRTMKF